MQHKLQLLENTAALNKVCWVALFLWLLDHCSAAKRKMKDLSMKVRSSRQRKNYDNGHNNKKVSLTLLYKNITHRKTLWSTVHNIYEWHKQCICKMLILNLL